MQQPLRDARGVVVQLDVVACQCVTVADVVVVDVTAHDDCGKKALIFVHRVEIVPVMERELGTRECGVGTQIERDEFDAVAQNQRYQLVIDVVGVDQPAQAACGVTRPRLGGAVLFEQRKCLGMQQLRFPRIDRAAASRTRYLSFLRPQQPQLQRDDVIQRVTRIVSNRIVQTLEDRKRAAIFTLSHRDVTEA